MNEYREKVERLAATRSTELIYNSSPEHACTILRSLLETADDTVCLVTERLNPHVFGDDAVVSAARTFLSDGEHKLKVLIETDPALCLSAGHPFVEELRQHGGVELRQIPDRYLRNMDYHFTVADRRAYRFEPDKTKFEASACFNDEANAEKLASIFDVLWDASSHKSFPRPLDAIAAA